MALWAGGRKGSSPERPAWEWVSICEPPPSFPSPSPSLPPVRSSLVFFFLLSSSRSSRGGGEEVSSHGLFTDISEIFLCKENIWTYFLPNRLILRGLRGDACSVLQAKTEDQAFWAAERNFSFLFRPSRAAVSRDSDANLTLIPKLHRKKPCVPPFSIIEHTLSFTIFHFPLLLLFLTLSLSPFPPSLPPPVSPHVCVSMLIESGGRGKKGDIKLGLWLRARLQPRL